MVIWIGFVVHSEGSADMAGVGNVVNFLEGLSDKLCWSMKILPHVGTCGHSTQNGKFVSKCVKPQVKRNNRIEYL